MPRKMQKFLRSSAMEAAEEVMTSAAQQGLRSAGSSAGWRPSRRRSVRSQRNKPTAAQLAAMRKLKKKKRKIPSRSQALFDILGGLQRKAGRAAASGGRAAMRGFGY